MNLYCRYHESWKCGINDQFDGESFNNKKARVQHGKIPMGMGQDATENEELRKGTCSEK